MTTRALHAALQVEGFTLPENCREVRLILGVDAVMLLQFDVFVTDENLARLGRAFLRMSEKEKKA
jgi:hypothetical protein